MQLRSFHVVRLGQACSIAVPGELHPGHDSSSAQSSRPEPIRSHNRSMLSMSLSLQLEGSLLDSLLAWGHEHTLNVKAPNTVNRIRWGVV